MCGQKCVGHPADAGDHYRDIFWQNTCPRGNVLRPEFEIRMSLRIYRDQPVMRFCGTLLGIGFLLVGVFSALGAGDLGEEVSHGRAMGFGITAVIVGVIAVLCSLLVKDLSDIWCRHPRR